MNLLIGDIGNTTTKICLINSSNLKIKKIIYFDSRKILSKSYLTKRIKKFLKKNEVFKISLFSSVVPKYFLILKKLIQRNYIFAIQ